MAPRPVTKESLRSSRWIVTHSIFSLTYIIDYIYFIKLLDDMVTAISHRRTDKIRPPDHVMCAVFEEVEYIPFPTFTWNLKILVNLKNFIPKQI